MVMMSSTDLQQPTWKKSSRSGTGPDSNCVEVAYSGDSVLIRDSKQAQGRDYPVLTAAQSEWNAVIHLLR